MAASSTLIKIFFNEDICRKFEENFSSRPFIFEKSFNLKNEANVEDKHEKFVKYMTTTKRTKMLVDLCEPSMTWIVLPEAVVRSKE
ncbi:hypothetical protein V6N12_002612 [Hibiscus sabdariffa]|uniref:Uncharacterized protein n=1 Tax=Hibiscus sabdariffa TaxID=183260 RepID=A0ABR2E9H1_9ROSI